LNILSYIDVYWAVAIILLTTVFALMVRFKDIPRNLLVIFILYKFLLCITFNLWALQTSQEFDAISYYIEGKVYAQYFSELFLKGSLDYFQITPFYWIDGISTDRLNSLSGLLITLTQGSFIGSSLLLCLLGSIGQLLIFCYLRKRFPEANYRYFYLILFHPSSALWSSLLLKDTIGIFALGLCVFHMNELLGRVRLINLLGVLAGAYLAYLFRPFILLMVLIFLMFVFWDRKLDNPARQRHDVGFLKFFYISATVVISISAIVYAAQNFGRDLVDAQQESDLLYRQTDGASNFTNAKLSFSLSGLLAFPIGIFNCLLRPYPWEIGKLNQLLAAFENVIILGVVGIGWRTYLFRSSPQTQLYARSIMYGGLLITLVCGAGIGLFSSNIGSISRYRIPVMPLFLAGPCVVMALASRDRRGEIRHKKMRLT
jgi:hypothetical protein